MSNVANTTYPNKIVSSGYQITAADATTIKDIYTAPSGTAPDGGANISALIVSTTDTVTKDISIYLHDGVTQKLLATVSVPASTGLTNALPPMNLLQHALIAPVLPKDANGNPVILLEQGHKIQVGLGTTLTAAKFLNVIAMGMSH